MQTYFIECRPPLLCYSMAAFTAGDDLALRLALKLRPWEWPTLADPKDDRSFFHDPAWWDRALALYVELKALAEAQRGAS